MVHSFIHEEIARKDINDAGNGLCTQGGLKSSSVLYLETVCHWLLLWSWNADKGVTSALEQQEDR